jgi:hypothetical protein
LTASAYRLLREEFGPKRAEVAGEWEKIQNEEFYDLNSLPRNIYVKKSGRVRWTGHVARTGEREMKNAYKTALVRQQRKW